MKDPMTVVSRFSLFTLAASVLLAPLGLVLGSAHSTQAAVVEGGKGPQLLIGRDDDNKANVLIQAGVVANQSLDRTDVLEGGPGNDVNLWAPGDGSEAFLGGPGVDAIVFAPPIARYSPIRQPACGFRFSKPASRRFLRAYPPQT